MFYLRIFQLLVLVLMLVAAYTQIFAPLSKGTKLFPWFSGKRSKLEKEFTNVRDEIEIHALEEKLEKLKALNKASPQNTQANQTNLGDINERSN